jgi:hypothetical protein
MEYSELRAVLIPLFPFVLGSVYAGVVRNLSRRSDDQVFDYQVLHLD